MEINIIDNNEMRGINPVPNATGVLVLGILSIVDGLKLFAGEEQIDHINNQMMLIMCELLTNLNKFSIIAMSIVRKQLS